MYVRTYVLPTGTPVPSKDNTVQPITMISAQKRISDGKKLFENLPSWLLDSLFQMGVIYFTEEKKKNININSDNIIISNEEIKIKQGRGEKTSSKGFKFQKNALKTLKKSFFLFDFLLSKVEIANNFNFSLMETLDQFKNPRDKDKEKDKDKDNDNDDVISSPTLLEMRELHNAMKRLIVQPPLSSRNALEQLLVGTNSTGENSGNNDDEDFDENSTKTVRKDKDGKFCGNSAPRKTPISGSSSGLKTQIPKEKGEKEKDRDRERERDGEGRSKEKERERERKRPHSDSLQHLPEGHRERSVLPSVINVTDSTNSTVQSRSRDKSYKKGIKI